jgi:hypothetical protein
MAVAVISSPDGRVINVFNRTNYHRRRLAFFSFTATNTENFLWASHPINCSILPQHLLVLEVSLAVYAKPRCSPFMASLSEGLEGPKISTLETRSLSAGQTARQSAGRSESELLLCYDGV